MPTIEELRQRIQQKGTQPPSIESLRERVTSKQPVEGQDVTQEAPQIDTSQIKNQILDQRNLQLKQQKDLSLYDEGVQDIQRATAGMGGFQQVLSGKGLENKLEGVLQGALWTAGGLGKIGTAKLMDGLAWIGDKITPDKVGEAVREKAKGTFQSFWNGLGEENQQSILKGIENIQETFEGDRTLAGQQATRSRSAILNILDWIPIAKGATVTGKALEKPAIEVAQAIPRVGRELLETTGELASKAKGFFEESATQRARAVAESASKKAEDLAQQIFQPSPQRAARDPRLINSVRDSARLLDRADSFEGLTKQLKGKKDDLVEQINEAIEPLKDNPIDTEAILASARGKIDELSGDAQTREIAAQMDDILKREVENIDTLGGALTVRQAQDRKVKLNALLQNFFKKPSKELTDLDQAKLQALNEIRRGYMDELEKVVPELGRLNEDFGTISVLQPMAEAMRIRSGNVLKPSGIRALIEKLPGVNFVRQIVSGRIPVDEALRSRALSIEDELGKLTGKITKLRGKAEKALGKVDKAIPTASQLTPEPALAPIPEPTPLTRGAAPKTVKPTSGISKELEPLAKEARKAKEIFSKIETETSSIREQGRVGAFGTVSKSLGNKFKMANEKLSKAGTELGRKEIMVDLFGLKNLDKNPKFWEKVDTLLEKMNTFSDKVDTVNYFKASNEQFVQAKKQAINNFIEKYGSRTAKSQLKNILE